MGSERSQSTSHGIAVEVARRELLSSRWLFVQFAEYVLKIDPKTEKASFLASDPLVGRNTLETIHPNKWQNGFTAP